MNVIHLDVTQDTITLGGSTAEFDALQAAMFDRGNGIGAMQVRLLIAAGDRVPTFLGIGAVLAAAKRAGLSVEWPQAADEDKRS